MPSKTANLTSGSFTATVSAITSAFGDPTRRAVYLFARESETGVTAAQAAPNCCPDFIELRPKGSA